MIINLPRLNSYNVYSVKKKYALFAWLTSKIVFPSFSEELVWLPVLIVSFPYFFLRFDRHLLFALTVDMALPAC